MAPNKRRLRAKQVRRAVSRLRYERREHTNPEEHMTGYEDCQNTSFWRTQDALDRNGFLRNMFTAE